MQPITLVKISGFYGDLEGTVKKFNQGFEPMPPSGNINTFAGLISL